MRSWALLLGGMIVWAIHFFTLYAIGSIFLTTALARVLTLVVTAACLAADALLLWWALRALGGSERDEFKRWLLRLTALIAAISLISVLWQGFPAILI